MITITRALVGLALMLLVGLAGCLDHRLNGTDQPSQPRLRLKRTTSTSPGFPGVTEFVYDQQGRQAAFIYVGDRATFTYDANGRLNKILYAYQTTVAITGEQTIVTYDDAQRQVRAALSNLITVNGQYTPQTLLKTSTYTYDAQQNLPTTLVESTPTPATVSTTEFSFAGGNLVRTIGQTAGQTNRTTFDYSYDGQTNPFYGLIGPGITDARRFSRNNVVKTVVTSSNGGGQSQLMIQYEYNAQGFPTSATAGNTELRYEYETY